MMNRLQPGDLVYAAVDLYNDPLEESGASGIPGAVPGELLVEAGVRGVIINIGHAEDMPDAAIYLVRFELDAAGNLALPIGCLAEELSQQAPAA